MTSRRTLLAGLSLASALTLTGCGFHLRGTAQVPFKTLYLKMPPNTPFSSWLERRLRAQTTLTLVHRPEDAEAILELVNESKSRDVLTLNDAGRVREYRLESAVQFRLTSPSGEDYIPVTRLSTIRDINYSEDNYLTQNSEEATLYRDMTFDLVEQIIAMLYALEPKAP